jgi:YgiT-type zinc finger domain-containing protein
MVAKECPMCGETMRLREREVTDRVPGTHQVTTRKFSEWVCPECDYFEESEDGES